MERVDAAGWTEPLPRWYAAHGRHHLPWRHTRDPWPVLVSEVMLQQTSVARVLPRWTDFMRRWPAPGELAATPLDDLLRWWDGLGYPRRARALHATAGAIATAGWPRDEAGLRSLAGVGTYTARALAALALDLDAPPPRDVNLARVAARAVLGAEPHQVAAGRLDAVLGDAAAAAHLDRRHLILALFDIGATVCLARAPRCGACPLAPRCASRHRLAAAPPTPAPRRQPAYHGSQRQLRGAVLRALLGDRPPRTLTQLRASVAAVPAAARPGAVEAAVAGLQRDGLIGAAPLRG